LQDPSQSLISRLRFLCYDGDDNDKYETFWLPLTVMDTLEPVLDIPQQYLSRDVVMTGPASARTSRTRVDHPTAAGSSIDPVPDFDTHTDREATGQNEQSAEAEVPTEPQVSVTFLLISGKRRTMLFQSGTTVGRVKELVWNGWPTDWQDERPPAPLYLRLLYLGRMLQDDETLTQLNLHAHIPTESGTANTPPSTIIHLSIRPYAPAANDDLQKKSRRRRERTEGEGEREEISDSTGCCSSCVIS